MSQQCQLTQIHDEPQPHRERDPQEGPEDSASVFEAEDHETKDERLNREATSLEHLTLHDKKNPTDLLRVLPAG